MLFFTEGGRLARETAYAVEQIGEPLIKEKPESAELIRESLVHTHQLVIQSPKQQGANILHASALKEHLDVLTEAAKLTVQMYDT